MSDELPPLAQTPLIDLLRGVPVDAVMSYEHSPTSHQNIPVQTQARFNDPGAVDRHIATDIANHEAKERARNG